MGKLHTWQRGAADLVSTVVGMTMLAIAFAGTSAAMTYGRATLIKSEHYKIAAYHLRTAMEETSAFIQLADARNLQNPAIYGSRQFRGTRNNPLSIENGRERNNGGQEQDITIVQDYIQPHFVLTGATKPDYYTLKMRAFWYEPDPVQNVGQYREIVYLTSLYHKD